MHRSRAALGFLFSHASHGTDTCLPTAASGMQPVTSYHELSGAVGFCSLTQVSNQLYAVWCTQHRLIQTNKFCGLVSCYLMSELGGKAKCDVCCYLYHVVKPTRAESTAKVVALVLAIPAQPFKTGIKKITATQ